MRVYVLLISSRCCCVSPAHFISGFISGFYVWCKGNQVVDQSPSLQGSILSSYIIFHVIVIVIRRL